MLIISKIYSKVTRKLLVKKGFEVENSNEVERLKRQLIVLQQQHELEREQIAKCYILECQKNEILESKVEQLGAYTQQLHERIDVVEDKYKHKSLFAKALLDALRKEKEQSKVHLQPIVPTPPKSKIPIRRFVRPQHVTREKDTKQQRSRIPVYQHRSVLPPINSRCLHC